MYIHGIGRIPALPLAAAVAAATWLVYTVGYRVSKVAALYVQGFPDAQAVSAVDDVEDLTTGLSRKIWQKIMILENAAATDAGPTAQPAATPAP